jgi:hypothetical protein
VAADYHQRRPLCFRAASADDDRWVRQHAEYTGQPLNAILARMLADERARIEEAHLVTFGSPYEAGEINR